MTANPTAEGFEALIGSTFNVMGRWPLAPDGGAAEMQGDVQTADPPTLTLTEVVRFEDTGPFEQFRVTFVGPLTHPLDQGTFALDPPADGFDALFLVPTAERGDLREYTASLSVPRTSQEGVGP